MFRFDRSVCWSQQRYAERLFREVVTVLFISLVFLDTSASQPVKISSRASIAEKIYLQLSNNVFETSDIIWFKAIVVKAYNHEPGNLSRILHVELISPQERIIDKKLIRLQDGIGEGFFELNQIVGDGIYLIRAYTDWNRNFGSDFIFSTYVHVIVTSFVSLPEPIGNISILKEPDQKQRLKFTVDPLLIDLQHKKDVKISLDVDNKSDTLVVSRDKEGKYLVNYDIPGKSQFATIKIHAKNRDTFSKTIGLGQEYPDIQFFPESGELVDGLRSKVGFKATGTNGKGTKVKGEILSADGQLVTHFESNELGMGSFVLTRVDGHAGYLARITNLKEGGAKVTYPLPSVSRQGNTLAVFRSGDEILVRTSSSYLKKDSIFLVVSCRGAMAYILKAGLSDGVFSVSIPKKRLPEGVIAFTMADSTMNPLAERLYFNERPESRLDISLSAGKNEFAQRELTNLTIETKSVDNIAVNANLSLLVLNMDQLGEMQGRRQNILSCLLLASDLKGEIENPGYYFRQDSDRFNDLDALLLTQGWRKYLYSGSPGKFDYQPETFLSVSGTVSGLLFTKRKKIADLTLMTFGKPKSVYMQKTDSLGRFKFDLNDEYGKQLNILIQSVNKSGKNWDYTIKVDKYVSPKVRFDQLRNLQKAESFERTYITNSSERKKAEENYRFSNEGILLGEVEVAALRLTPARKRMLEQCGKPSEIINGEDLVARKQRWSYGLYSILRTYLSSILQINFSSEGVPYARVRNSSGTLVTVDGVPLQLYEYEMIPYIPPEEIKFIDIYEHSKNFPRVFAMTYPDTSAHLIPTLGNIIAIYTVGGKGIYGTQQTTGMVTATVPVFSAPREFYSPNYNNNPSPKGSSPDLRALIHWEPILRTDSTGRASTSFYNADITGRMLVVVEAISDRGEIGYKELVYQVKQSKLSGE